MPDMFGRETIFGGAMAAENTHLTFASVPGLENPSSGIGLLIQQLQIQYAQNITRLYALEDSRVYFVAGRTEGQFTIQNVVGPAKFVSLFLKAYGDVCKERKAFELSFGMGCGTGTAGGALGQLETGKLTLQSPVISSFGVQMQAGNMIIATTLQGMFVSLQMPE